MSQAKNHRPILFYLSKDFPKNTQIKTCLLHNVTVCANQRKTGTDRNLLSERPTPLPANIFKKYFIFKKNML